MYVPPGTEMFHFPGFAPLRVTGHDSCWVAPFGHPRIKACVRLPTAFRRLLRPSSPLCAKASTVCPCLLAIVLALLVSTTLLLILTRALSIFFLFFISVLAQRCLFAAKNRLCCNKLLVWFGQRNSHANTIKRNLCRCCS